MFQRYQLRAYRDDGRRAISIYVDLFHGFTGARERERRTLTPTALHDNDNVVCFAATEPKGWGVPPTFVVEYEEAQRLIDDLWAAGLRPTEGSGSAGALAATQAHVADLRTLLFHQAGIKDASSS